MMKKLTVLLSVLAISALMAGCGGGEPAVPTLSVGDVQSTAVSAAFTIVAETQAAIPTNTPLPPTETPTSTPAATNTSVPLPTLESTLTNTPASTSGDPCATRVLGKPLGKETTIKIENLTKSRVAVSLYLNETASHNECGYRYYELSKNGSTVITDLVTGCYNLWAWNLDGKAFNSSGSGCINNPDKWTFQISEETIKFIGP
ncbi:MAG: hypothetical protein JNJ72_11150 [Anaerolineales bacterium]|nr:hypothetical protein [Anaerolineales bacterium]